MAYPKVSHTDAASVPSSPRFPAIEEQVLAYWKADGTFEASVAQRDGGTNGEDEFVFYDGPPFANGLPHYGHLLTGYVKDIVPRFQTMRGKRVERRFGWDTHGLPAELEAMRLNDIKTTDEIALMGIDKFNDACRASVLKYAGVWQDYVTRQARWVDFDNDYKTMNPEFMESVIWAFKQLHSKDYVYEGFRVLPYCWNDETPLSNHELKMDDDVYKMRQDPAVTVGFEVETEREIDGVQFQGAKLLIWSTTPWTLPSNLAVMVGSEIEYVLVETPDGDKVVLAAARLASYKKEFFADADEATVLWRGAGAELVGLGYVPPFSYYLGHENAFRVIAADDAVTTDSGTGLVHAAGGFGEVDKEATDREGIESVVPVGKDGRFTAPVTDYKGVQVFEANKPIIADLKARTGSVTAGTLLVRQESYEHSYPHCWRCRQPLIYKGVSSWFVEVTKFKDQMLENNEQINWVPDHIKHGQFGKWVANARDWSITRNRFWGSPVPVWKSDNPDYPRIDVYGSFAEIEADFGRLPLNAQGEPDLHRPWIDDLTRPNPDDPTGQSTMRRVSDVLDVWFDSGSMSFAQNHYPFENRDWFDGTSEKKGHFPGDFIVEYIGQTRGWFYTLHILATGIFGKPAFKNVISHGIVLGSDGQKMSKSLRNYPDVSEVFDRDGADAMRWFLMSSPILRGGNLVVTEQGIRDSVRQVMIPLWNTWYFFQMYANAAGYEAERRTDANQSTNPMDRYLLAKTRDLVERSAEQQEAFDIAGACESLRSYLDVLTNWYVRRSRERFWAQGVTDGNVDAATKDAFDTLYTVLETVLRVAAPLLPLVSEEIWRGLTGGRSVHLTDWPSLDELPADDALVAQMDLVRDVCSAGSALRKGANLRNRLPLAGLTVVAGGDSVGAFTDLVADELNLKSVTVVDPESEAAAAYSVEQKLTVNARAAGPRLGKNVQLAIKGSKSGDWSVAADGTVTSGGLELVEGEYTLETVAGEADDGTVTGMLPGGGFVVLDTVVTPELAAEGIARDVVRAVQQARKDAGLDVSDKVALVLDGDDAVKAALATHRDLVAGEVQATSYELAAVEAEPVAVGDGNEVRFTLARA